MITIPPLRDRREDIPLLFKYYLAKTCRELGVDIKDVETEVMEHLTRYDWPGNVRELQNVIERVINLVDGSTISLIHLPSEIYHPAVMPLASQPSSFSQVVRITNERAKKKQISADRERELILDLLVQHGGNVSKVAKELGMSRNTFYRKIRLYKIEN